MAITPMTQFIHGVQLNEMFYREAVAPILAAAFPELRYSAALIGHGSDVLGYDSERSTDHGWGPRLLIFLPEEDYRAQAESISEILSARLPREFRSYSTNFAEPNENRVRWMVPVESGRVRHHVYFHTVRGFIGSYLGIDSRDTPTIVDWLLMYQNALLEITGGAVYHDGLGELIPLRQSLAWYPREVWLFMLASQWIRIAQEEPFPSRWRNWRRARRANQHGATGPRRDEVMLSDRGPLRAVQQMAGDCVFPFELRP